MVDALSDGGGTRAGAVWCLGKWRSGCRVYVRSTLGASEGLAALRARGAFPWPNPKSGEELGEILEQRGGQADETGVPGANTGDRVVAGGEQRSFTF